MKVLTGILRFVFLLFLSSFFPADVLRLPFLPRAFKCPPVPSSKPTEEFSRVRRAHFFQVLLSDP